MTVNQMTTPVAQQTGALAGKHPLSLPTLELVERALVDTLQVLRQNVTGPADRDAGAIEYASWLRRPH